jgi:predicted ribosomally synthesized peptide with nif11-like leader
MSKTDAVGFLERVESDQPFARELDAVKSDPNALHDKVKSAGFDAQPEEIREAFVDRYGSELTPEQLDQIAAGMEVPTTIFNPGSGSESLGVASAAAV